MDETKNGKPATHFIDSYLDLTVTKTTYKYPTLQSRHIISGKLDDDLVNMTIEMLEKTGWSISDVLNFIFRQYAYLEMSGILSMFTDSYNKRLLDDDEQWKKIREKLKSFIPGYVQMNTELAYRFKRY
jgi:hypothetical protein